MKRLVSTRNLSKEDWLRYRKCGITGTDAGAILGLNPYRSAFQVYHDKISDTIENIDNEAMRQGRDLEDYVAQRFSEETGFYVSWAYAWAEVKKLYPSASYEVKKFNGLPYVYDPITGFMVYTSVTIEGVSHEMWLPVLDGANKAMKAVPYTYTTPKWDYNPQTRRREKIGMEERTVEAASMFDVNKAIMRCLVKNLAMFGLGLYVYAGEDLPEDAAPQPEAEPQKQPKPRSATPKQEQPPVPCICARCNQPIKRVKLKDGSIMQAAEFAATHEGMCADCYKATRLNVA